jgi:carbonic anhydrase
MRTVEITYRYGAPGKLRARPMDADAARLRLTEGNRTFATLLGNLAQDNDTTRRVVEVDRYDLSSAGQAAPTQRPFAAVLGCSDARVPTELLFTEGPNDLFVVRVAGNGLGSDVLGSLRYAIEHLRDSLRLVVVLGHSGCGALTAAVDAFLEPGEYLTLANNHALRSILDRQLIVVQASARRLARSYGAEIVQHSRFREALTETAIAMNAALAAYTMQEELQAFGVPELRAVFGVYLLQSHQVWAPTCDGSDNLGLADPPSDLVSFSELNQAIVRAECIASLLQPP